VIALALAAAAWAGVVTEPPGDALAVGLLLCAGEQCDEQLAWLAGYPEPVIPLEALVLGLPAPARPEDFEEPLTQALAALEAEDPGPALVALERAEGALARMERPPTNEELFTLYLARGAARSFQLRDQARDALFQQAAAVAWNRAGRPDRAEFEDAPWLDDYYAALEDLLESAPATLVMAGEVDYSLDGIALGAGPHRVQALPGRHLVTAASADGQRRWRQVVQLEPGERLTVEAAPINLRDPAEVCELLLEAHRELEMEPQIADLLYRWSGARRLVRLRLMVLTPAGDGWEVSIVDYDPIARRYDKGPR
jgi:hypothetical protein